MERKIFLPVLLLAFGLYLLFLSILNFDTSAGSIFNIIGATILTVYIGGRIYGEINVHKDFIDVSTEYLEYRETPPFGMGWIPKSAAIPIENIGSVDMVQVSSFLQPERKNTALQLRPKMGGKFIIIGSRLSQEQIVNILLALRGSVTFSSAIKKLLGDDVNVGDLAKGAMNFAKGVFSKMQEKGGNV